jgi:hypothetical protein
MKNFFLLYTVFLFAIGCQTADQCRLWDESPFLATFTALQDNEKYILSVKFNAKTEADNDNSYLDPTKIKVEVIIKDQGTPLDTVTFYELFPSGIADKKGKANVILYGTGAWRNSSGIDSKDLTFTFQINTEKECYYQDVKPQKSSDTEDVLTLFPSANKDTDSTITFILYAQRNALKVDVYLPSSEKLRVIIFSEKGEVKWNSSFNRNFLQMVTPVYPESIGEIHKYSLKWDGYDNHAKPVPAGTYRAQLIIPSKPNSYSESIVFRWKM